jgi:glycosyltransferase involved in cell wall biosynthesis
VQVKILLNCPLPFALAHGGMATQIVQTKAGLEAIGVEVEYLRWWDETQRGDLIHSFGSFSLSNIELARSKNIPVVITSLLSATCNRSDNRLRLQRCVTRSLLGLPFGEGVKRQLLWRVYTACARNLVGLQAERQVLEYVYGVPRERIALIPLGLPDIFLNAGAGDRKAEPLVCIGTITAQKNCVPLARLAHQARVPVLFVGKPYFESDPYWAEFRKLVDGVWVRHQPHVSDPAAMLALLHHARGAVVMSQFENWCLVAHEAAACGLPVLLPDQKWSRERFGDQAHYFDSIGYSPRNIEILKQFYADAPNLPAPKIKLFSWAEVAQQLKNVYEQVLKNPDAA